MLSQISFGQKLVNTFATELTVHARKGLNLRSNPSFDGEKKTTIPYGTKVKVMHILDTTFSISGLDGTWCKVAYGDTSGYVFDAYLSSLPFVSSEERYPYMKDYLYKAFEPIEGNEDFEVSEFKDHKVESEFPGGTYRSHGTSCEFYESFECHSISMEEAIVVFTSFNETYSRIDLNRKKYEWNESEKIYTYSFDYQQEPFPLWYQISYRRSKGEYKMIQIYFDWEGGGGDMKFTKTENGVKIEHFYGCH